MGTRRDDYVVLGADLGVEVYDRLSSPDGVYPPRAYEKYGHLDSEKRPGDFIAVFDGMDCEFFIVGRLLHHSKEHEGFPVLDFGTPGYTPQAVASVSRWIKETWLVETDPGLIVFSHWH